MCTMRVLLFPKCSLQVWILRSPSITLLIIVCMKMGLWSKCVRCLQNTPWRLSVLHVFVPWFSDFLWRCTTLRKSYFQVCAIRPSASPYGFSFHCFKFWSRDENQRMKEGGTILLVSLYYEQQLLMSFSCFDNDWFWYVTDLQITHYTMFHKIF